MATTTTPILYNTTSGFTLSDINKIQIVANSVSLINNSGYSTANPNVLETFQMQASALSGFTETANCGGSDNVQYTVLVNGVDYYWSGSAWATRSGAYAQATPPATIKNHCNDTSMASLLGTGAYVQVRAFLHSSA